MILHEPVLPGETIEQLAPAGRALMVDCTVGTGGHTEALFQAGATRVLGFDRDAEVLSLARERLSPWLDRLELVHGDYREFGQALDERGIDRIDGALADLGHSTVQLETDGRGFSFRLDAPLDMRMDRSQGQPLAEMLDEVTPEALAGWVSNSAARALYIEAFKRSDFEAMLHYYKANYPRPPYTEDTSPLVKVQCPVLVIHGLEDQYLLAGALDRTWEWIDNDLTLVTIPGSGHFVQQDATEIVNRSILAWLNR